MTRINNNNTLLGCVKLPAGLVQLPDLGLACLLA